MELEEYNKIEPQKESIKLIKNTKGYQWEIKVLNLDVSALVLKNEEMIKAFGVVIE